MVKAITLIMIGIIAVFVFFFVFPIVPNEKNNLTIKYFDEGGDFISEDTVSLKSSPLTLQSIESMNNLPDIPAEAVTAEYTVTVTNTGNIPIVVAIINAEVEGAYLQ